MVNDVVVRTAELGSPRPFSSWSDADEDEPSAVVESSSGSVIGSSLTNAGSVELGLALLAVAIVVAVALALELELTTASSSFAEPSLREAVLVGWAAVDVAEALGRRETVSSSASSAVLVEGAPQVPTMFAMSEALLIDLSDVPQLLYWAM
jgi:hypothetical protein